MRPILAYVSCLSIFALSLVGCGDKPGGTNGNPEDACMRIHPDGVNVACQQNPHPSLLAGEQRLLTVDVTGPALGQVALEVTSATALPAGLDVSLASAPIPSPGTTSLVLDAAATVPAGTYRVQVTANFRTGVARTTDVDILVSAPAQFGTIADVAESGGRVFVADCQPDVNNRFIPRVLEVDSTTLVAERTVFTWPIISDLGSGICPSTLTISADGTIMLVGYYDVTNGTALTRLVKLSLDGTAGPEIVLAALSGLPTRAVLESDNKTAIISTTDAAGFGSISLDRVEVSTGTVIETIATGVEIYDFFIEDADNLVALEPTQFSRIARADGAVTPISSVVGDCASGPSYAPVRFAQQNGGLAVTSGLRQLDLGTGTLTDLRTNTVVAAPTGSCPYEGTAVTIEDATGYFITLLSPVAAQAVNIPARLERVRYPASLRTTLDTRGDNVTALQMTSDGSELVSLSSGIIYRHALPAGNFLTAGAYLNPNNYDFREMVIEPNDTDVVAIDFFNSNVSRFGIFSGSVTVVTNGVADPTALIEDPSSPNHVLVLGSGFNQIIRAHSTVGTTELVSDPVNDTLEVMVQGANGSLWVGHTGRALYSVDYMGTGQIDVAYAGPIGSRARVSPDGELLFVDDAGLFKLNTETWTRTRLLIPEPTNFMYGMNGEAYLMFYNGVNLTTYERILPP